MFSPDLTGPGVLLQAPQTLYPPGLSNAASIPANNRIGIAPGQSLTIPRGSFMVALDDVGLLQWYDPVSLSWRGFATARQQEIRIISDGSNYRVANLTSCLVGAVITNAGTAAYAQATTTVVPSAGNSTWLPVIGGQVSATGTIVTAGSGYGVPPLCFVPAPPFGLPASFVAAITNGTVSSLTCTAQGAGYTSAPPLLLLPNPFDPNVLAGTAITAATATLSLVTASGTPTAGKLCGLVCTNNGQTISSAAVPTLTITGSGASAAATTVPMWTATGISISGAGTGIVVNNEITSVGGVTTATPAFAAPGNPEFEFASFIPRKASMLAAVTSATVTSVSAIYDGGLFTGTPGCMYLQNGIASTGTPTLSFTLGGVPTFVTLQPLG
jgi:hypothetical protein